MEGEMLLLLHLAALVLFANCQQQPQVSISPNLTQVYSGDFFSLTCDTSYGMAVKWFFNNQEQPHQTRKSWRIAAARLEHSGDYHCVVDSVQSNKFAINVLGFIPRASLMMKTGQPVMRPGSLVTLQIEHEDGLQGWRCWVYRGGKIKYYKLRLRNDTVRLSFSPTSVVERENIFWCTDKEQQQRSNQIIVQTSDKPVSLEMYPFPALAGSSVTLKCLVWGTDLISNAGFYVNTSNLHKGTTTTYTIPHVTNSAKGSYKCDAVFEYTADRETLQETSDDQVLEVYDVQMRAELSEASDDNLFCSCPLCTNAHGPVRYRWYSLNKSSDQWSLVLKDSSGSMRPQKTETYSCRAVWKNGRSLLSGSNLYGKSSNSIAFVVTVVLILLGVLAVLLSALRCRRQRQERARAAIYEDVALQSQGKQYEPLQKLHGNQQECEYETLQPGPSGHKKDEGGYEALRKQEGKQEIYHTLQIEGAASGTKEYEVLRREGMKQEVYHTLQMGGAGSGTKDYEELRQGGRTQEIYHTLHMQGVEK